MFEPTASGQALGDAGEEAVFAAQQVGQVVGCGLAFDVGTEREAPSASRDLPGQLQHLDSQ